MLHAKQEVRRLLNQLPENISFDDIQHHIIEIEIGIEIAIGVAIGHTDDGFCVLPFPRDSQVRRYDRQYNLDRTLLKTKYDQIV